MRHPFRTLALCALVAAPVGTVAAPASSAGLGSLYSCDAEGTSNTTGAVVGGLVGALAGSQVSRKNRAVGAVIGAGLGAAIGNGIGCKMDRKAQQDARQAFQRALDTGRPQSWADPQTGASGHIEVLGPGSGGGQYESGYRENAYTGRWRFASGVTAATRVSNIGGAYAGAGRVNIRAAPSASAPIVDRLQPGEEIQVAGAAPGGWLAVIEDGLIQGYVASSVVRPAGGVYGGGDRGGGDCRLVQQTVTERGGSPYRERYNACRDPRGEWNLTAA